MKQRLPSVPMLSRFPALRLPALRLPALACVAVSALAATARAQGSDTIYVVGNDKPQKLKILEETLGSVHYQISGGGKSSYTWDKVARIVYGEGDGPFRGAEDALTKGDFAAASKILEGVQSPRDIFVPRKAFLLGRALQGSQKPKEAEAQYAEVIAKHPESRWVKSALKALVELQKQEKNFAGAVETADRGIRIAQGAKIDALALEFRLEKASVLEAQETPDKLAAAGTEYGKVAADAASSAPKVAHLAQAYQARVLARQQNTGQAKQLAEALLKGDDASLLTVAHAAMGEALLVEGIRESNAEKLKEAAVNHFLRVEVQFPPGASESQEPLESALCGFVRASAKLADLEKAKKEDADFWKQQAATHAKDFLDRFASSRYAKQVRDTSPR